MDIVFFIEDIIDTLQCSKSYHKEVSAWCVDALEVCRFRIIINNFVFKKLLPNMGKIASIEYFRVPPRWLFVKIADEDGNVGWGEASLEGHTQAVEGCLDSWIERYIGFEAESV